MKQYKLFYYNLSEEGEQCFEHKNPAIVSKEALRRSSSDNGKYTYRMETWQGNKLIGEFRFFQNGMEFTDQVRADIVNT